MEQAFHVPYGSLNDEACWLLIVRGLTQIRIAVNFAQIQGTCLGEELARHINKSKEHQDHSANALGEPFNLICVHCRPTLERLAPSTHVVGLTLEDFLHAPIYNLELLGTGDGDVRIQGEEILTSTPSFDIATISTIELLGVCNIPAITRFRASKLSLDRSEEELNRLSSVQGKVAMAGGVSMYFKARQSGREGEFERELRSLYRISETEKLARLRLAKLIGLVVSGEQGEMTMGMLIETILGEDLLSKRFWGSDNHELHTKWERQVTAVVRGLHACQIVWGDVDPGNVVIDEEMNAWVIDFGGMNNPEFVDDDKAETVEGDLQGVKRLFQEWLPDGWDWLPD